VADRTRLRYGSGPQVGDAMLDFVQNIDPFDVLRIGCGLFFLPHLVGKVTSREFALDFFAKVGFRPPAAWLYAALAIETAALLGLVFDVCTRYAAILGALFLLVAAYGLYRFTVGHWRTKLAATEYPLFWAMCCGTVAMHG
jgi:putative oxidoreductase